MRSRPSTQKLRHARDLSVLRRWLRDELSTHADPGCVADVVVATQEAVTNSLRSSGAGRRPVSVRLHLDDGYVWVDVEDCGPGFSVGDTGGERPSTEATGGRGLYLMRFLMDVLEISALPYGSRVRMGKRLSAAPAAAISRGEQTAI